jgi:tetratricopeptide (TPR) repeat protein
MKLDVQLAQLENSQLVRRQPDEELAYSFKHALTQEAAYQSLLLKTRREIHRRVAAAYEQLDPNRLEENAALLVRHYAEAGDDAKTFEYALRAGDVAARVYAYPEARLYYAQALASLGQLPDTAVNRRYRIDLLTRQVIVSYVAESPEVNTARLSQAETLLQTLSSEAHPQDKERLTRVSYWLGMLRYYANQLQEAISYFQKVLASAQEGGDTELLAIPSSVIGRVKVIQGYYNVGGALLNQASIALEKANNWPMWIMATCFLGQSLAGRGNYRAGVAAGERALARAEETNNHVGMALSHASLSIIHLMGGNMPKMMEEGRVCVEVAEQTGDHTFVYCGLGFQSWAKSRLGLLAAAAETMNQAEAVREALGGRLVLSDWFDAANAEILLKTGQVEAARALAEKVVASAKANDGIFAEGLAQRVWAEALVASDHPQREEADPHFAESLQAFEPGEARLEAARTHVVWGKLLARRGDVSAGREHLAKAAAQFEASGLTRELDETRAMIAALPSSVAL